MNVTPTSLDMKAILKFLFILSAAFLSSADPALQRPSNVHSTIDTEVTLMSLDKKRSTSDDLKEKYHMKLTVGDKEVALKLSQKGHRRDVRLYKARVDGLELLQADANENDWAIYQGDGNDSAAVLVKRVNGDLKVEGSMIHGGEYYMIQPSSNDKGHVLHQLKRSSKREPIPAPLKTIKRASSSGPYEVELFMFFDHGVYYRLNKYKEFKLKMDSVMKEYYGLIINDMDYRYRSLNEQYKLDIRIVMAGMTYFTKIDDIPYSTSMYPSDMDGTVNSRTLLDEAREYVNKHKLPFDDVIVQSGFNFPGNNKGMGHYLGTCRSYRISVVTNNMDFNVAHISAHELGHNLNMNHDINGNYVMRPHLVHQHSERYPQHAWQFSHQSYLDVMKYIGTLDEEKNNCLLKRTANMVDDLSKYGKKLYGQILSYDQQCEMMLGNGSKHCVKDQIKIELKRICFTLFCTNPHNSDFCYMREPYPGTSCGNKKMCKSGKCIESDSAKYLNEKCPFGDRPDKFIRNETLTCQEAVGSHSSYCYDTRVDQVEKYCCDSCEKLRRKDKTYCRYGDYSLLRAVWVFGREYRSCKSLVTAYPAYCLKFARRCCESCPPLRNNAKPSCPYGDHVVWPQRIVVPGFRYRSCKKAVGEFPGVCYEHESTCCESCEDKKNSAARSCEYGDRPGKIFRGDNGHLVTCAELLSTETAGYCYDDYTARKCCATCKLHKNVNNPSCEYGDKPGKRVYKQGTLKTCKDGIVKYYSGACTDNQIRKQCCETCEKFKTSHEDCKYGEVPFSHEGHTYTCEFITNLTRGLCYEYEKECCETCKPLKTDNSEHPYGDEYGNKVVNKNGYKKSCKDAITKDDPSACYDRDVKKACSESCTKFKKGPECEYGDQGGKQVYKGYTLSTCKDAIVKYYSGKCTDSQVRDTCCESCAKFKTSNEDCEFGEVPISINGRTRPCSYITKATKGLCYRYEKECCETCKTFKSSNSECRYGDKPGNDVVRKNRRRSSCKHAITEDNANACYDKEVENACCDSCARFGKGPDACKYGDKELRRTIWVNGDRYSSCASAFESHKGICYDHSSECCVSCKPGKDSKCPFGDHVGKFLYNYDSQQYESCTGVITDTNHGACYLPENRKKCCESCAKYHNPTKKGCEYGDKDVKPIWKSSSNGAQVSYSCKGGIVSPEDYGYCYEHAADCCFTCSKVKKSDKKGCEYGDWPGKIIYAHSDYYGYPILMTCKHAVHADKNVCNHQDTANKCCRSCKSKFKIDS